VIPGDLADGIHPAVPRSAGNQVPGRATRGRRSWTARGCPAGRGGEHRLAM